MSIRTTSLFMANSYLSMGVNIVHAIFIARAIILNDGIEIYGLWVLLSGVLQLVCAITVVPYSFIRSIRRDDKISKFSILKFWTALRFKLSFGIFGFSLVVFAYSLIDTDFPLYYFMPLLGLIFITDINSALNGMIFTKGSSYKYLKFVFSLKMLRVCAVILFIFQIEFVLYLWLTVFLEFIILIVLSYQILQVKVFHCPNILQGLRNVGFFTYYFPTLMQQLRLAAEQPIIGQVYGPVSLGNYSIVSRVFNAALLIVNASINALLVISKKMPGIYALWVNSILLYLAPIFISFILVIFHSFIIEIWLGSNIKENLPSSLFVYGVGFYFLAQLRRSISQNNLLFVQDFSRYNWQLKFTSFSVLTFLFLVFIFDVPFVYIPYFLGLFSSLYSLKALLIALFDLFFIFSLWGLYAT